MISSPAGISHLGGTGRSLSAGYGNSAFPFGSEQVICVATCAAMCRRGIESETGGFLNAGAKWISQPSGVGLFQNRDPPLIGGLKLTFKPTHKGSPPKKTPPC